MTLIKNLLLILVFATTGCKKQSPTGVIHAKACMTVDKKTASPGDTITFSDCSKFASGGTQIYFTHEQTQLPNFFGEPFNKEGQYSRTFPRPGEYVCVVVATSTVNGARMDRDSVTVTIVD